MDNMKGPQRPCRKAKHVLPKWKKHKASPSASVTMLTCWKTSQDCWVMEQKLGQQPSAALTKQSQRWKAEFAYPCDSLWPLVFVVHRKAFSPLVPRYWLVRVGMWPTSGQWHARRILLRGFWKRYFFLNNERQGKQRKCFCLVLSWFQPLNAVVWYDWTYRACPRTVTELERHRPWTMTLLSL